MSIISQRIAGVFHGAGTGGDFSELPEKLGLRKISSGASAAR